MGLRLTLIRNTVLRHCCWRAARLEQQRPTAVGGREHPLLVPALAVRTGVDASIHGAAGTSAAAQEAGDRGAREPAQKKQKREKRPPPPRPTHFLALQVSQHADVVAAIGQVQESLMQHSGHLKKACVEAASAHLTLGVMALNSDEERQRAAEVLAALAVPLGEQQLLAPVEVQLEGLSHFRNQVLYLDLKQDGSMQQLKQLAAASRAHFHQHGLLLEADRQLVPHVTIAKTSKLQGGNWGGKRGGGRGGHSVRDWRQERRKKQQRRELEQQAEEALLAMDCAADEPAVAGTEQAGDAEGIVTAAAAAAAGLDPDLSEPAATAAAGSNGPEQGNGSMSSNNNTSLSGGTSGAAAAAAAAGPPQGTPTSTNGDQPSSSDAASLAAAAAAAATEPAPQNQPQQQEASWRQIPAEAWAKHVAIVAGTATLAEIQLCAMQGRKPGQYYNVLCSLPLVPKTGSGSGGGSGSSGEQVENGAGANPSADVDTQTPSGNVIDSLPVSS